MANGTVYINYVQYSPLATFSGPQPCLQGNCASTLWGRAKSVLHFGGASLPLPPTTTCVLQETVTGTLKNSGNLRPFPYIRPTAITFLMTVMPQCYIIDVHLSSSRNDINRYKRDLFVKKGDLIKQRLTEYDFYHHIRRAVSYNK